MLPFEMWGFHVATFWQFNYTMLFLLQCSLPSLFWKTFHVEEWRGKRGSFLFWDRRPTGQRQAQEAETTWQVIRQVERRFHSRDSNRQPLPWDLGIPLPSPGSLRSSWTREKRFCAGGKLALHIVHTYKSNAHKGLDMERWTLRGKKFPLQPSVAIVHCLATHGEKMHRWIILVVDRKFLVAVGTHLFGHRLVLACNFG